MSQEELRGLLARRGTSVTQATLSRDLRTLGVVKGPAGYRLPEQVRYSESPIGAALDSVLSAYVTSVRSAGNIVVVRTGPGHAQVVGLELDRSALPGVVGTIAGDDTIFIAAQSPPLAASLAKRLTPLGAPAE